MQLFLDILMGVTLPILVIVALGYGVQRRLSLDVATLTRVQMYVLVPAALIRFPTAAKLPFEAAWPIVWFCLAHSAFLFALGWGIAAAMGLSRNARALVAIAALLSNSGNYGIPLVQLAFSRDYVFYQTVVLSLHSIIMIPMALLAFEPQENGRPGIVRALFGTPMLPAAALGYLLKGFDIAIPSVAAVPLKVISDAFTPMALLLLGIQLAAITGRTELKPLALGLILRLAVAPATAWIFGILWQLPPDLIAFVVVSSSVPVGMLLAIFAAEYKAHPRLASMMVFLSIHVSALGVALSGFTPFALPASTDSPFPYRSAHAAKLLPGIGRADHAKLKGKRHCQPVPYCRSLRDFLKPLNSLS